MSEWKTFPLSKPIKAHGKEIGELKLREPTATDLMMVGNPVNFDPATNKVTHDMPIMGAMVSRLAEVPPSSIGQMQPEELVMVSWELTPFFVPLPRAALQPTASA